MPALKIWDGTQWAVISGADGADGADGAAGTPGSVWRSGAGAPSGALGVVTDWYLNESNGDVYEKTGVSTYTLRDNLTGPTGAAGTNGTDGATGATGAAGVGFATWSQGPAVAASSGGYKWKARRSLTVTAVSASLGTAPTGADGFTVNVRKNGTTILSSVMTFAASDSTKNGTLSGTPTLVDGDYLDVVIASVTGTSMERLTVQVEMV